MIYERILIKNHKSSETVKLTKSSILNLSIKIKKSIINKFFKFEQGNA